MASAAMTLRRTVRLPGLVLAVLALLAGPLGFAARAGDPTPDVVFERDIVYGQAGDEVLKLNLAMPAEAAPELPAVVLIHGGAWRAGDRSTFDELAFSLARAGFVAATVGYRFCPEHRFPAQLHDVQRAVRFLRANAPRYHIDRDRVGAMGFSAGAQLAMLLGTVDHADGLDESADLPRFSAKVAAVVAYFGPTDLELPATDATRPLLADLIGGPLDEQREAYRRASPVTYVSAGDAPMLLFQGTDDPLVPHVHATRMADALQQAGVHGRVELLVGAGHGDWSPAEFERTGAAMVAFFRYHLGNEPSTAPEIATATPYFEGEFDARGTGWYSEALRAMREPSLLSGQAPDAEIYRFLWLRSFHHPIAVRITRQDGAVWLHAVELDGAAGDEPGRIARRRERPLDEGEWQAVQQQLDAIEFWALPTEVDHGGKDGARWILEGWRGGKHHVTDRWSPESGAYREAGLFFLQLSGLPVPEDDVY